MKSRMRSRPPVFFRLESSDAKFDENGPAATPSVFRRLSSCLVHTSAGAERLEVLPRLSKKVVELFENAGRLVNALSMPGAATPRLLNTGVVWSAKRPRRSIAGPSCSRNGGKSLRLGASAPRGGAVARAPLLAR